MEEKFLNKIQKIIEELNKLDKMPNVVEWNDKRAASQNFNKKEKIYENSKEGEILQILDETTDIEERKENIEKLKIIRNKKKEELKKELNNELENLREKLNKESERLDRKIQKARDLNKRVRKIIANNNALLKNRDENSLVYKAAKEENEKAIIRKNKMPEIIKNLKDERKRLDKKINFYNNIDIEKDGINKMMSLFIANNKIEEKNDNKKESNNKDTANNNKEDTNSAKYKTISSKISNDMSRDYKNIHLKTDTISVKNKKVKKIDVEMIINKIKNLKIIKKIRNIFYNIKNHIKPLPERIALGAKKEDTETKETNLTEMIDRMQIIAKENIPVRTYFVDKIDNKDSHIETNASKKIAENHEEFKENEIEK